MNTAAAASLPMPRAAEISALSQAFGFQICVAHGRFGRASLSTGGGVNSQGRRRSLQILVKHPTTRSRTARQQPHRGATLQDCGPSQADGSLSLCARLFFLNQLRVTPRGSRHSLAVSMQLQSEYVDTTTDGAAIDRLQLPKMDRLIYFAPALFFAWLAALCTALILTSIFLVKVRNPEAIAGAGIFGLLVTAGLGALLLRAQLNDLRYVRFATRFDAQTNYGAVLKIFRGARWTITSNVPGQLIDARVSDSLLSRGEWVAVRFRGREVWIASICDPRIGFSLVARRRCRHYKELVKSAVCAAA